VKPASADKPRPPLWHEPAPHHLDAYVPWWIKLLVITLATIGAMLFVDTPVALWAMQAKPIDLGGAWNLKNDVVRELAMLEQWGQWVCSILVVTAVAIIDRAGRRRALAITIGCLLTVMLTYLLKDLCGRSRPYVLGNGLWEWGGPAKGFTGGSEWGAFPSAHTTGAFALSVGLSWYYPRARPLFMTLATITALQRIFHAAHYVSDVLAGLGIAVLTTRATFQARLAGRYIALTPRFIRDWYLRDWAPTTPGESVFQRWRSAPEPRDGSPRP
jgi:membrane-associated phospholipid phosphatase